MPRPLTREALLRVEDRFFSKVDPGLCWEWQGKPNSYGYGRMRIDGDLYFAHRIAWELLVGPIPEGLVIDHMCVNKICVCPEHLDPVTQTVNAKRGKWVEASVDVKKSRTHCIRNHPLFGDNLYVTPNGRRNCRECRRTASALFQGKGN